MSNTRSIKFIKEDFDEHSKFIINKINEESISLGRISNKELNQLIYPIVNLIDFKFNGDYSQIIDKTINDIHLMYSDWYKVVGHTFTTFNYIENNNIIFDYRINGIGYYWVDLNCYYSSEMLFRLHNCARVNSYQNFLELREYTNDGYNHSRVVIVIDKSGFINQIKGDYDIKPNMIYKDYIYDLFLNYKELCGFKFMFKNTTNFTLKDLSSDELNNLKKIRPELFTII
jgi:hypothetical protein